MRQGIQDNYVLTSILWYSLRWCILGKAGEGLMLAAALASPKYALEEALLGLWRRPPVLESTTLDCA